MTKEKIAEIEELGQLQFSIEEMLIIADLGDEGDTPEVIAAHRKGRLIASAMVRRSILEQAKNGSTPAQKQMMDLIQKAEEPTGPQRERSETKDRIAKNEYTPILHNVEGAPEWAAENKDGHIDNYFKTRQEAQKRCNELN